MDIVETKGLYKTYSKAKIKDYAVYDVSLNIKRSEILGLVGESGCGKSTLGRLLLRLEKPTMGTITFEGKDITNYSFGRMRRIRHAMQIVFQGSSNSFNPYYTVRQIIAEPLNNFCKIDEAEKERRITAMLEQVDLGSEYLGRYSNELSGGQRQRVGIARALIIKPEFVVCDEAVSSVDYIVKKQILKMLAGLKGQYGFTCLFISHDMEAIEAICDRIAVMYLGNIVEIMPHADSEALHPYTRALLAATLAPDPTVKRGKKLLFREGGDIEIPERGCIFQGRCLFSSEKCLSERPGLAEVGNGHFVACHRVRRNG